MKNTFRFWVSVALIATMVISISAIAGRRVVVHKGPRKTTVVVKKRHVVRPHVVKALPPKHLKVIVKDRDYYFNAGAWYGPGPDGFRIVMAPRGARVKVLPMGHAVVVLGSITYYHYYGAYYRFDDQSAEYYVVDAPEGAQTTDVIYLVDGDVLKGTYLGGNDETVQFQVGEEMNEIDLTDIVSIAFEPPSE